MNGLCECGCGQTAPIATKTKAYQGHVRGQPMRFVHGHNARGQQRPSRHGPDAAHWKGGRRRTPAGYVVVCVGADHPMAQDSTGEVLEHRLVMAAHIGRSLRRDEVVHHENEIRDDNRIENLRLFASNGEHTRHHARVRREQQCA